MSRKQLIAPMISPLASRSGSMLSATVTREPSARSTMISTSRAGSPVASTSAKPDRASGLPSMSKKRTPAVNSSCRSPGFGARPQISAACLLYCRMVPRASQMKVAIGKRFEDAVGGAQHRLQRRGNRPLRTPIVRIEHLHGLRARTLDSPESPRHRARRDGDLSTVPMRAKRRVPRDTRVRRPLRPAIGRFAAEPVIDEGGKPMARGMIVHRAVGDMLVPLLGAGQVMRCAPRTSQRYIMAWVTSGWNCSA